MLSKYLPVILLFFNNAQLNHGLKPLLQYKYENFLFLAKNNLRVHFDNFVVLDNDLR